MVKPVYQRGFIVSGKFPPYEEISYSIDGSGLEKITLVRGDSKTHISYDEGIIRGVSINCPQLFAIFDNKKSEDLGEDVLEILRTFRGAMPEETVKINIQQAQDIYGAVVDLLDVKAKIRDYAPQFSSGSELTLYNILGIDNASEIKSLSEERED